MDFGDVLMDNPNAHEYFAQMQAQSSANNAFNAQQAQNQMNFQVEQNAKAMDFNHREAELNRQWQKMMSDTAYQRQVQDMINAGLNPVLGVSNSGASVPSGATAQGVSSSGGKAEADTSLNSAFSSFLGALINGATSRDVANISAAASMHNAQLSHDATIAAAGMNAAASRYAADVAAANVAAQLEQQAALNPLGLIESILSGGDKPAGASATVGKFVEGSLAKGKQWLISKIVDGLKNPYINASTKDTYRSWLNKLYTP